MVRPMTNDYPGIFSIGSNQYIHVNHGWWCTECTNHLFELDGKTDHTSEWIDVLRQWSKIALLLLWDSILGLAIMTMSLFIGTVWILFCFFEGVDSDTRIYEQQLREKDGLERGERDDLTREYNQLLKERHYLVVAIDQCKTNLSKENFVAKEKSYKKPEQDFMERGIPSRPPGPKVDEDRSLLDGYSTRLATIEANLADFEKKLKTHQGV
ncbi:hypothetical protein BH11CYA1_BH11CYA1_25730 [soil metagenome]